MRDVSVLTVARELTDLLGIAIFPVAPDKAPLIKRWGERATTDPQQIEAWFADGDCLIGVPTGARNGIDALDIDPRHHGDKWLEDNKHRIPPTRIHQTRASGQHFIFKHREGVHNLHGVIAPGVD